MEFLNPLALYGFLALPLLLVPYLIRRKPRRIIFSSLVLFTEFGIQPRARPWGRLRLPPIFFLQLLLLILLILALGEPVFSVRASNIAIVIDNSASMQASDDGKTRFASALDRARDVVDEFGAGGSFDFYRMVPTLEKINKTPIKRADASELITRLQPYDLSDVPADYNNLLNQLVRDQKYDRLYLITDRPVRGQSATVRAITVGQAQDNLAIDSFTVSPSSLANARLTASVEVTNFSARDQRVKILLKGNNALLASREIAVPAGRTISASFQGFAEHPYYQAELEIADSLVLDNRQFALGKSLRNLKILGISPRPKALTSLRAIPGVSIDTIDPAEYDKTDRSQYALEIFHLSAPAILPASASMLVLPPEKNPLVQLGTPITRVVISGWRESHPLSRYVNFPLFRPSYARPLKPQTPGEPILESPEGILAFATQKAGVRHLVLGFDPFPYLGRDNLPMSIFTLNFLDWFIEAAGVKSQLTGAPLALRQSKNDVVVINPKGEKISVKAGSTTFSETVFQGIYEIRGANNRNLYAINYHDPGESNLREAKQIELQGTDGSRNSRSTLFSFWPYLLMLSLLLFVVEGLLIPSKSPQRHGLRATRAKA